MSVARITAGPPPTPSSSLPNDQEASGRSFGREELAALSRVLDSGTLNSTRGTFVRQLETRFATLLGTRFAHACSSGTSAIHTAIAAVDPEPGDEVIVSPVTDMGALTPVLYQGAIPVFADVDPITGCLTAETIEERLSERVRAIVVTHLFGHPCEMEPIMSLSARHGIPVIEDCAQAYLARDGSHYTGTFGHVGCFSLQQGKHATCGEGGLVVTANESLSRRMFLFINKAWGYGDPEPDHYFLALNSRMSELQGAVALAQLEKLPAMVEARESSARQLTELLTGVPGITLPVTREQSRHAYWRYCLLVHPREVAGGAVALAERLAARGYTATPRYILKPAFAYQVFREQRTFGSSRYPFNLARREAVDYRRELFPGTHRLLENILVLPWNERYDSRDVHRLAEAIRSAIADLTGEIC